jgi:hypothetical protein
VDTITYIRDLMTTHHKLMADVAVLLRYSLALLFTLPGLTVHSTVKNKYSWIFRTISKIENLDFPGICSYLARYKEFSDLINSLVKLLGTEELTVERTGAASTILDR